VRILFRWRVRSWTFLADWGCSSAQRWGAHIAHAMEMCAVFYGNGRSSDISDKDALFENLDSFRGGDGSVNLATGEQRACGNDAFNDGEFPTIKVPVVCISPSSFPSMRTVRRNSRPLELNPFPREK
jgi:hypothetical protein